MSGLYSGGSAGSAVRRGGGSFHSGLTSPARKRLPSSDVELELRAVLKRGRLHVFGMDDRCKSMIIPVFSPHPLQTGELASPKVSLCWDLGTDNRRSHRSIGGVAGCGLPLSLTADLRFLVSSLGRSRSLNRSLGEVCQNERATSFVPTANA